MRTAHLAPNTRIKAFLLQIKTPTTLIDLTLFGVVQGFYHYIWSTMIKDTEEGQQLARTLHYITDFRTISHQMWLLYAVMD